MKKIILSLFVLLPMFLNAAIRTDVTITDLNNNALTQNIERNLSALISELNSAWEEKRNPNWKQCRQWADERTCNSLSMLWENSPFRCSEEEIVEIGMSSYGGEFEVRNLPFIFSSAGRDDYHEAAVTFNNRGVVTSFHMMISTNLYRKVIEAGEDVRDLRQRQMILQNVEEFRTAYEKEDIQYLERIFSEDALIITGKVIKIAPTKENNFKSTKIQYSKQDKKTYLKNLKAVFAANQRIRVNFSDVKVERHPIEEDFYGVTLHQGYSSDRYSDEGYLFLLWDFRDQDNPMIHVRTWQPDTNPFTKQKIKEEDIFSLADCDL